MVNIIPTNITDNDIIINKIISFEVSEIYLPLSQLINFYINVNSKSLIKAPIKYYFSDTSIGLEV
ncbi:MAG: hypothetical protein V6008_01840 [Candidatus Dasytiphilus stammeri]